MKPLAFVSVRVEHAGGARYSVREIAVLRAEAFGAEPSDVYATRVRATGERDAAGGAVWLVDAMDQLRHLTRDCVLVGFDVTGIRALLEEVCDDWELLPLELAPETLDLGSLAWPIRLAGRSRSVGADDVCAALDVARCSACALDDVRADAEAYRRLVVRADILRKLAIASPDERAVVSTIVDRIDEGRRTYGPWRVDDGRNNPKEALAEVMDALNYCAAELVRLSKGGRS